MYIYDVIHVNKYCTQQRHVKYALKKINVLAFTNSILEFNWKSKEKDKDFSRSLFTFLEIIETRFGTLKVPSNICFLFLTFFAKK